MTNPDYTHAVLVIDRSGSMESVRNDAQGGINAFLRDQYALDQGKFTTTLVQFDTEIETVSRLATDPISYTLEPRGGTALFDAVGIEIHKTGADLGAMDEDERPGRVLFVIVTDGEENSSHEYGLETVRSLVEHQRDVYNWNFQFIGADEAAWQGEGMGMQSTRYVGSGLGNVAAYASLGDATTQFRSAPMGASFMMPEELGEDYAPETGSVIAKSKPAVKKATAKSGPAKTTKSAAKPAAVKKTAAKAAKKDSTTS